MLIQKSFDLIIRNWRKEKNTISQDGTITYADSNKFTPIHFYASWKVAEEYSICNLEFWYTLKY